MSHREVFSRLDREASASPAYNSGRAGSERWKFMLELLRFFPKRGELLHGVSTTMRIIDDIADGDLPPPDGYTRVGYLERTRDFIQNPYNPEDDLDHYMLHCLDLASSLGIDIRNELDFFFIYFLFDAKRLGTGQIFPQADLDAAFNACARGTIGGMLKVFGESESKVESFLPLGKAFLTYQTLRDFKTDIAQGRINIPLGAFNELWIDPQGPLDRSSPGINSWFNSQAVLGLNLLEQHQQAVRNVGLPLLLRKGVLPLLYERPARTYFNEVLAGRK